MPRPNRPARPRPSAPERERQGADSRVPRGRPTERKRPAPFSERPTRERAPEREGGRPARDAGRSKPDSRRRSGPPAGRARDDRGDKPARSAHPTFIDRFRRDDRPPRDERPQRDDRPARRERPQSDERPARSERPERSERPVRSERPAREERPVAPAKREFTRPRPQKPRGHLAQAAEKPAMWVPGPDARVVRAEVGLDLAHFLVNHTGRHISVRAARRALESGACRIDGRIETFGSRILRSGEVVEFFIPEDREHHFDKRRVLFDDVGVVAYDKPPFLPVTPTDGPKSWSLLDILKPKLGELFPVHRLDADTSGIVLFARNEDMAKRLETLFKDHAVEKTYLALVRGHPPELGERRSYLVKVESRKGFERWASGRGADAREAITTWKVLERVGRYASLVEVKPKTGRYHQIRIHFSEMDFPLYGDRLYGDRKDPVHCTRHLLHASRIKLPHPAGGPNIDLTAPLPMEFGEAAEKLAKL